MDEEHDLVICEIINMIHRESPSVVGKGKLEIKIRPLERASGINQTRENEIVKEEQRKCQR